MKKDELIIKLKENMDRIKGFGVKKIGIFGAASRGELTEKSDVDIVVEFEKGKATFKNFCGLVDFLEELLEKEVDILTPDGIENIRIKHIKEQITKELIYV